MVASQTDQLMQVDPEAPLGKAVDPVPVVQNPVTAESLDQQKPKSDETMKSDSPPVENVQVSSIPLPSGQMTAQQ